MTSTTDSILDEVLSERLRQVQRHGFTSEHDDRYRPGTLLRAAVNYLGAACMCSIMGGRSYEGAPPFKGWVGVTLTWPWDAAWWRPGCKRAMLITSMALIAAEVEAIDRASERDRARLAAEVDEVARLQNRFAGES